MKKIQELSQKIKKASLAYYRGEPIMTDAEFDALTDQLREIDPQNEVLSTTGWGASEVLVADALGRVKRQHTYRLPKLEKIHDINPKNIFSSHYYTLMPKFDGSSVVVYYKKGLLDKVLTRGDGIYGVDVTDKFKGTKLIPQKLSAAIDLVVRGEYIISDSSYKKNYQGMMARNQASGFLLKKNYEPKEREYYDFIVHTLLDMEGMNQNIDPIRTMDLIASFGFKVSETRVLSDKAMSLEAVNAYYDEMIDQIDYLIDGIVITSDYVNHNKELGYYYEQIAFKRVNATAEARVLDIKWNLTRTQKMYPVATIAPTELSGAIIKNISLYSYDNVQKQKVGRGALIRFHRSGEIIPTLLEVLEPSKDMDLIPKICPVCKESLSIEGVDLVCNNPECENLMDSYLWHFISLRCNLLKLGKNKIQMLLDAYDVKDLAGFLTEKFNLIDDLANYEGIGESTVKLYKEFLAMRKNPMTAAEFLESLGIEDLGKKTCQNLLPNRSSLEESGIARGDLNKAYLEAHKQNYKTPLAIVKNINYIRKIYDLLKDQIIDGENNQSENHISVVITGKLSMPRKALVSLLESKNIQVLDSIKEGVKFLITDDPEGKSSKNKKANQLGIPKINEKDFRLLHQI